MTRQDADISLDSRATTYANGGRHATETQFGIHISDIAEELEFERVEALRQSFDGLMPGTSGTSGALVDGGCGEDS